MIKTIKVKKKLRLDELIKYVWDNELYPETFKSNFNDFAHFDKTGKYRLIDQKGINQATKFTVEVEEEVTEDTRFKGVQEIYIDAEGLLGVAHHPIWAENSINDVLGERDEETECLYIYAAVDGKTELIWEADSDEL